MKKRLIYIFILFYFIFNNHLIMSSNIIKIKKIRFKAKNYDLIIIDKREKESNKDEDITNKKIIINKDNLKDKINIDDQFTIKLNKDKNNTSSTDDTKNDVIKKNIDLPENLDIIFKSIISNYIEKGDKDISIKVYIIKAFQKQSPMSSYNDYSFEVELRMIILDKDGNVITDKKGFASRQKTIMSFNSKEISSLQTETLRSAFLNAIIND